MPRAEPLAVTVAGKIHVVGGRNASGTLTTSESFDPETTFWSEGASLSVIQRMLGMVSVEGRLVAIGLVSENVEASSIESYEVASLYYVHVKE